ncbi:MAG: YIP1 family protein [Gemmatimonadales bacterium]
MTDTGATVTGAPTSAPSFWEDLIDIFISPVAVYRRRQYKSAWPPMLFVAIAIGVITYFTFNAMMPLIDGDIQRAMTQQMAKNPQLTQEMVDRMRSSSENIGRYTIGPIILISMTVLGLVGWLVGKLLGSKQTVSGAMVMAGWAYMPRVLGAVIGAVQALVLDVNSLTTVQALSLSPARFLDPDKASPLLYQMMTRLDLMTIWVTILLGIGMYVTGRLSKERAAVFGVSMWILGSLWPLRTALMSK